MTKFEFEERVGTEVTDGQYKVIEFVYTWHPHISATKGKDQMAALFKMPEGMSFIASMHAVAVRAKEYRDELDAKRAELERVRNEYERMVETYKRCEF